MPTSDLAPAGPCSEPTLVLLHFLGGSGREWEGVVARLAPQYPCLAIDLPGFGKEAQQPGYDVAAMADRVAEAVRAAAPRRWALVGHSMGAKVAAALARRAEDGEAGLGGLCGLVLLAGSPPSPEPMEDAQRAAMMGWFAGDAASSHAEATNYIRQNSNEALTDDLLGRAVDDVLMIHPAAWHAWLESGSREDWADRVGVLATPALIVAGEADDALGPEAQGRLMAPHFASHRLVTLPGAKHLLPMECADAVARLIAAHVGFGPGIDPAYRTLINSDRVSERTRAILLERAEPHDPAAGPAALTPAAMITLRAVLERVVPQGPASSIDLAAGIDAALATKVGDGWRFAALPPDIEAYAAALQRLEQAAQSGGGRPFARLDPDRQDALLRRVAAGELAGDGESAGLSAAQLKLWFEDLRGDAVRTYVSHPQTMARIGFSGIANGGDGERKQGYVQVGPGEREPWEPIARPEAQQ